MRLVQHPGAQNDTVVLLCVRSCVRTCPQKSKVNPNTVVGDVVGRMTASWPPATRRTPWEYLSLRASHARTHAKVIKKKKLKHGHHFLREGKTHRIRHTTARVSYTRVASCCIVIRRARDTRCRLEGEMDFLSCTNKHAPLYFVAKAGRLNVNAASSTTACPVRRVCFSRGMW